MGHSALVQRGRIGEDRRQDPPRPCTDARAVRTPLAGELCPNLKTSPIDGVPSPALPSVVVAAE